MKFELRSALPKMARSVLGLSGAATASERVTTVTNRCKSLKIDSVKFLVFLHEDL